MLKEKCKKKMDFNLEYISDQTSKYSDWIAKDLKCPNSSHSSSEHVTPGSVEGECIKTFILIKIFVIIINFSLQQYEYSTFWIFLLSERN